MLQAIREFFYEKYQTIQCILSRIGRYIGLKLLHGPSIHPDAVNTQKRNSFLYNVKPSTLGLGDIVGITTRNPEYDINRYLSMSMQELFETNDAAVEAVGIVMEEPYKREWTYKGREYSSWYVKLLVRGEYVVKDVGFIREKLSRG